MKHGQFFEGLSRCPHCGVANPSLQLSWTAETANHAGGNKRRWGAYWCLRCGDVILARGAPGQSSTDADVDRVYPRLRQVDPEIPEPARRYLEQAHETLHAPDAAVMTAASAVDAMLKAKGYEKGWISERIEQAAKDGVITQEMKQWAHAIRLEANYPRHADTEKPHATEDEAKSTVEFADVLAQFMFVLPARVSHGIDKAKG